MGNIPYMTPYGSFIINGAERVIVSQLPEHLELSFLNQSTKWNKAVFSKSYPDERLMG
jgi:DNA-directed RNA polymerase beta subunit